MANRDIVSVIKSVICEAMPTTAVASGFVSAVNFSAMAKRIVDENEAEMMAAGFEFGMHVFPQWLADRGYPSGVAFAKAVREDGLWRRLRREAAM